jgi:hypothetical protein
MGTKRIKYKEYGFLNNRKSMPGSDNGYTEGLITKYGKYTAKFDIFTNRHVIDDEETKTTYQLEWAERHAFGDAHKEFGSIQEWYESLDKETQDKIIRIPLDDEINT